ncbi:MATE family efflux transporter [Xenophilus sp. Marseille-Q4582]|uniref:MATE family efflux transporter n=1 Tax=Xenophilus sp. Marseille-Q4582 TaxID=2866600 RepID=UPI001CE3E022|nr:MATE family efflux transporter [Xenophilus sp. Marseille-Q4582]
MSAPAPAPVLASRFVAGPITPTLLRFAWPLLATNLLHAAAGTWSAVWVGQVLGANALTAVATATVLLFMLMGAVMGIGTAAGVAIGQSLGAGDMAAVKRVTGCALTFVAGFSLLVAAAGWALAPVLIEGLGTPPESHGFAVAHVRYTCLSMPAIFVYLVTVMMMRGAGDSRTPFRFTLVWIALSVLLVPALLTGLGGLLPGTGIAGVGLANLIAAGAALAALLAYVYHRRLPIALHGKDLRHLRPEPALLSLMVRRALPVGLESIVTQGAYFVLLGQVNTYGAATAAAYSGAAQLWTYVQMPSNALAASMSAMAAMNIGAGHWARVERIARHGCGVGLAVAGGGTLLIYGLGAVFGELPLRLFIPAGGEVLEQARRINFIVLWGWIALAVTMGLSAMVRANGAMLAPTLIFIVTMWALRVPFALGLKPWLGEAAIWWSFPFGSLTSALLAYGYYRWGRWRERPLMLAQLKPEPLPARRDAPR